MREVLAAFQHATGGVTCSQYLPIKEFSKELHLPSIPEDQEEEVECVIIPSSPGELFRSLEELKGQENFSPREKENLPPTPFLQPDSAESEIFETQKIVPETQLIMPPVVPETQMENDIHDDGMLPGLTSSPGIIIKSAPIQKISTTIQSPIQKDSIAIQNPIQKDLTEYEKKSPLSAKVTTPTIKNQTNLEKTPTESAGKKRKTPKSTDFKNAKKSTGEVTTPTERKKKKQKLEQPLERISTTMLSKEQSSLVTTFCQNFAISCNTVFDSSCSHLIVATNRKNGLLLAKRSFKYLQARLTPNVSIVSIDWIEECLKRKSVVEAIDYLVDGDEETCALAEASRCDLFLDYHFYFYGEAYLKPSLPDLLTLSRLANATIISSIDELLLKGKRNGLIVFCSPNEDQFERDAGVIAHYKPIISCTWILDCISLGRILSLNDYHIL